MTAEPYREPLPAGGLISITTPGLLWGQPVTYTFEPQTKRCLVKFTELSPPLEVIVKDTELELPPEALEAFAGAFRRAIESNEEGFRGLRQHAARAQRALERELRDPAEPSERTTAGTITTQGAPVRR